MKLLLIIIMGMLSTLVKAETSPIEKTKADLKKTNLLYASTPSFSMDIQYAVFDSHVGGNLVEQKTGTYVKHESMSYSKILNIETIINPKTTVIVNHDDKFIVITDTKKIELSPLQTNLDSLLKWCSSIKMQDIGVTERRYTMSFTEEEEDEFSKIELAINLSNNSIKKMTLYYNQEMPLTENDYYAKEKKPRLEITYKTFTPLSTVGSALFAESTYLNHVNTGYSGKGKTVSYEVINQQQSVRFKKK